MREVSGLLVLAALVASFVPSQVAATDSEAPPGASPRWLPCERWVMLHWLPYEQDELFRMLRLSRDEAFDWIADDQHRTFAQLLRRQGLAPDVAARRLVAPWTRGVTAERRSVLRERALRTLTQGHLSQHVLFHFFHHPAVGARARRVFNTSPMHYYVLRHAGYTPAEIGTLGGQTRADTARGVARVWRSSARRGVRRGETPTAQATRFAADQLAVLPSYLDSSFSARGAGPVPPAPRLATPRPVRKLLCTMLGGRARAADPASYGDELLGTVQASPGTTRQERGRVSSASAAFRSDRMGTNWACTLPGVRRHRAAAGR